MENNYHLYRSDNDELIYLREDGTLRILAELPNDNIGKEDAKLILEAVNNYEALKGALKVAEQALKDILNAADNNQPYNKTELVSNFLGDYNKIADTLHTVNELYS